MNQKEIQAALDELQNSKLGKLTEGRLDSAQKKSLGSVRTKAKLVIEQNLSLTRLELANKLINLGLYNDLTTACTVVSSVCTAYNYTFAKADTVAAMDKMVKARRKQGYNKGKRSSRSDETKQKISAANKGRKLKPLSEARKLKQSLTSTNSKTVHTPKGEFRSIAVCRVELGITAHYLRRLFKEDPVNYFIKTNK